jgi:BirA family biotin operon repressor/biotin-[acetyl-CoA-carboxylase] ligase
MKTIFLGKNCIEVDKVDSTNSYLAALAAPSGSPKGGEVGGKKHEVVFEGTIVVAKLQAQGRGQRGTTWESEPGKNLTLSILLQPTFLRPDEQFQLNKAVSLGVIEFVTAMAPPKSSPKGRTFTPGSPPLGKLEGAAIKWPNDIYIGSKKMAGILIENSVSGNKLLQSIIGIGINVNQEKFSAELPNPTSLKIETGKEFDLKECLEELCSCIEKRYLEIRAGHIAKIDADYLKSLYRFGELANYKYKSEILKAKITGISKMGTLMLETEKGETLECDFKEVGFC